MQQQQQQTQQYKLLDPPSDGIASLEFSPVDPYLLLAASWDKGVRLYDVEHNTILHKYHHRAPVLDACFGGGSSRIVYSGGIDRRVKMFEFDQAAERELGKHEDAVRCVKFDKSSNRLFSGSWDKTIRTWDHRAQTPCLGTYQLPDKVFSMDIINNTLVVAMANRRIFVYDTRNMNETLQMRESNLKYMTRAVKCLFDGEGFLTSSIEGRVAVEYLDEANKKFAFKCHRKVEQGVEYVYPVNALAVHPKYGTFATGGSDSTVCVWDGGNKKRIKEFVMPEKTGVSALSFNSDGSLLAIGLSYTYDEGERDHPVDSIAIRRLNDSDVRPKPRTK